MLRTVVNAILLSSALALPSASPDALPFDLPTELPAPGPLGKRAGYPFSRIVAFGDNLSDNGSGSVAHGVAQQGDPSNKIYGYSTWTNGPVAIQYLAAYLNMPLTDYAFGHANGGSLFGATVDNAYTQSTAKAPSSKDQIANYTSSALVKQASTALHFLWIGANDINLYHIGTSANSNNAQFATDMSTRIAAQVQTLINAGAPVVMVPNLYPKHLSPSRAFFANSATGYQVLGNAISGANTALQKALAKFGNKVVYFDTFQFMSTLYTDTKDFNFTRLTPEFCDGYSTADFQQCLVPGKLANNFYWVQYLDPTTHVHNWLGIGFFYTLCTRFGLC